MTSHKREPTVRYELSDHVARIELHRPASLNAWTPRMGTELLAAVHQASRDDQVRCVLVTGAGAAFSAGADIKSKRELTPDGHPDLSTRLLTIYNPVVEAIRSSPKPFVAAVHGACAGLGVSLALSCDLLIAARDAYFLLAFIHLGVMPDGGATSFLTERVGMARAAELCMLGERLAATDAMEWGLINFIHDGSEVDVAGRELASRLAAVEGDSVAQMKAGAVRPRHAALASQLLLEANLQQQHGSSLDYAEGRRAFGAKQRPAFVGS